ncbi:hypothetical protein JCM10908_003321 [Rhodotorula pacifica]|uniref:uncharacterized protein n=1 Tax=Rhodotorula pacifica TaxID=1495444 RepID=UPI00317F404B
MHTSFLSYTALALLSTATLAAPATERAVSIQRASTSADRQVEAPYSDFKEDDVENTGYRYNNKVLLFRHGEKRSDSSIGLSLKGKKRAQCLRRKLGKKSRHNIGLILAEAYNPDTGKRRRPFDTVKSLAHDLGLKVDLSCEADDFQCVSERVVEYARNGGKGDIAICWKHSYLHKIARSLGAKKTSPYPDERYDIIWTLTRRRIVRKESEQCPGLDPVVRRHDPDLEIDAQAGVEEEEDEREAEDEDGDEDEEDLEDLVQAYIQQTEEQLPFGGGSEDDLD